MVIILLFFVKKNRRPPRYFWVLRSSFFRSKISCGITTSASSLPFFATMVILETSIFWPVLEACESSLILPAISNNFLTKYLSNFVGRTPDFFFFVLRQCSRNRKFRNVYTYGQEVFQLRAKHFTIATLMAKIVPETV